MYKKRVIAAAVWLEVVLTALYRDGHFEEVGSSKESQDKSQGCKIIIHTCFTVKYYNIQFTQFTTWTVI